MKLYFHVDRAHMLEVGKTIEREPYHNESILPALMPFADDAFLRHIDKLCRNGLSLHGARYLIQIAHNTVNVRDFLLELQFEYVRNVYHKELPSRLQSLFAFDDYKRALLFKQKNNNQGTIYEINFSGRCFLGDMNWLKAECDKETQKHDARQYWEGKPYSIEAGYEPDWECVIDLPVRITREMVE